MPGPGADRVGNASLQTTATRGLIPKGFEFDPTVVGGSGAGMEGDVSIRRIATAAPTPQTIAPAITTPAVAAPPPVTGALPPPAEAVTPTPIAQGLIGAINRSSGDTGSPLFNVAAMNRAQQAGTSLGELITSIDLSRQRSLGGGIVSPQPAGFGGNVIDVSGL